MNRITSISIGSFVAVFALAGVFFLLAPASPAQACCGSGNETHSDNDTDRGTPPPQQQVPLPSCTLSVSSNNVVAGTAVTFTWTTKNAVDVTFTPLGAGVSATKNGSKTYVLNKTTTYTIRAIGSNGTVRNCPQTVVVTPPPKPDPICTLSGSPATIEKGDSATLTWTSTNATSASFNQGIGSVALDGSHTVSPTETTTYVGTFTGNGKTVTCSKTITVIKHDEPKHPSCDMWASPSTIEKGDDALLSWNSTNAQSASINQGIGSVDVDDSITVSPDETTTYTGTFYGHNDEKVTCKVTIKVTDEPEEDDLWCKLSVSDKTIRYGDKVTLSWDSEGADYGKINNGIGEVDEEGSEKVYPKKTTTYAGTFYNDDDKVTCKVTVKVEDKYIPPPVYPQTPYITLSSVPYTGLDLGPVGTAVYWSFLMLWCVLAAYLVAVKRIHVSIYRFLFGESEVAASSQTVSQRSSDLLYDVQPHRQARPFAQQSATTLDMDPFLASQIHRKTS